MKKAQNAIVFADDSIDDELNTHARSEYLGHG